MSRIIEIKTTIWEREDLPGYHVRFTLPDDAIVQDNMSNTEPAALSFPLTTPQASGRISTTYVAVHRGGALIGALNVTWKAKFPAGEQTGLLTWAVGEGGKRLIALRIVPVTSNTVVPITAGGASATLTVVP